MSVGFAPFFWPLHIAFLGFGVPYSNTFFLNGTILKYKFILFSPWLLKSPASLPMPMISETVNPQTLGPRP